MGCCESTCLRSCEKKEAEVVLGAGSGADQVVEQECEELVAHDIHDAAANTRIQQPESGSQEPFSRRVACPAAVAPPPQANAGRVGDEGAAGGGADEAPRRERAKFTQVTYAARREAAASAAASRAAIAAASTASAASGVRQHAGRLRPELVRLQYRDLTPEDYELLSQLDEGLPKRGTASHSLVARLPSMPASDCSAACCQVCLSELSPRSCVLQLPCSHAFHYECASKWLTQCRETCPVCSLSINIPLSADVAKGDDEGCNFTNL